MDHYLIWLQSRILIKCFDKCPEFYIRAEILKSIANENHTMNLGQIFADSDKNKLT